ncbi:isoprenylcysteine carboxyl methyltransferase family protein [Oceanobacillus halotolerans]|uniref:isoprenylcysteine carboxyl methyltransferase family protein n=1 Tax=Oceanobacillus halotolerans TaxID=2663380 RepID=UPI0013DBB6C0|nr:isoprenylcysteine carboxylmethyltransferase family protein [Oceanobacillus halotolerans]
MTFLMWILFTIVILQRLMELRIAKRNEQWMKERGALELGAQHYKWFVLVHSIFFLSILLEVMLRNPINASVNYYLLAIFVLTQLLRIWCIQSLGRFWNTKIIVLPKFTPITRGPYKYVKHPNYIIVAIELFIIPLLFGAYITAIIFPILHGLLLTIRIPTEEKALTLLRQ